MKKQYTLKLAGLGLHRTTAEAETKVGVVRYTGPSTRQCLEIPISEVVVGDYFPVGNQMESVWNGHREFTPVAMSMSPSDLRDVADEILKCLSGEVIAPQFVENEIEMARANRSFTPIDIPIVQYAVNLNAYEEHRDAETLQNFGSKLRLSNLLVQSLSLGSMCVLLSLLAKPRGGLTAPFRASPTCYVLSRNVGMLRNIQELFWLIGVPAEATLDTSGSGRYILCVDYKATASGSRLGFKLKESPEATCSSGGIIIPQIEAVEHLGDLIITPGVYPAYVLAKVMKIEIEEME